MLLTALMNIAASLRNEEGQGLAEYALILFFIAVVAIAALTFLGSDISSLLSKVATSL
jgi:Flp pilus assembly pilin Flp